MELQSLIYLFVGISFTIYFGIALWTKATSTKDFYIAKDLNKPVLNGVSIAVDFISVVTFVSFGGVFLYASSYTSSYIIGLMGGFVLLTILIVPYLRKIEKFSIPEFLELRFYSKNIKYIAIFIVILVSFIYLNAQLKGIGIIFSRIFHIEFELALYISVFITLVYVIIGGVRNITYSQIAQFIIILFAFMTPIIFLSISLVDSFLPQLAIFSTINFDFSQELKKGTYLFLAFEESLKDFGIDLYANYSYLNKVLIAISLMFGVATLPHILIKFFSTKNIKDSRKSIFWALLFVAIIYTALSSFFLLSSVNSVKNLKNIEYSSYVNNELRDSNDKIRNGKWLQNWQDISYIEFDDLNKNNKIDFANKDNISELKIDPDILFLVTPEIANMPNWVIALVLSGALAAALSTVAAIILLIKTTIFFEIFEKDFNINKKVKSRVILNMIMLLIVVLATFCNIKSYTILQLISISLTLGAATFFPTIILAIFTKINKEGAISGLLVGFIFTLSYVLYYIFIDNSNNYFLKIAPEASGAIGAILNIITAMIVSKFTKEIPKKTENLIDFIRTTY